jgi:hypothetical protein
MENKRDTLLEFVSRDIHQKRGRGDKLTIQRRSDILWRLEYGGLSLFGVILKN